MTSSVRISRTQQYSAWFVFLLFVLGWFLPAIGYVTGPILGAWFVGTQKPLRGFLWQLAFSLPSVVHSIFLFYRIGHLSLERAIGFALGIALAGIAPFVIYRLTYRYLPGALSILPLPCAVFSVWFLLTEFHFVSLPWNGYERFLSYAFAALVIWLWHEASNSSFTLGAFLLSLIFSVSVWFYQPNWEGIFPAGFSWACVGVLGFLSIWALLRSRKPISWIQKTEAVKRLRSPHTGEPLQVKEERGCEFLVSATGERFAIQGGLPVLLSPDEISGDNRKYHHFYETIGGFYDDIQRVFCGLKGLAIEQYFLDYMKLLEVKPGDAVLETSVGTGLNLRYLPREISFSGLDLSREMLLNCKENLRRWRRSADLYLGNAEMLPFSDSSFDVVFHVGGINFFSDKEKAIQEMIRVAKPGSLLLIADETEKHVRSVYEKLPGAIYKDRVTPVVAPLELIPAEMQQTSFQLLRDGEFYVITFRKP